MDQVKHTFTRDELIAKAHEYVQAFEAGDTEKLYDFGLLVDFIFAVTGEGK